MTGQLTEKHQQLHKDGACDEPIDKHIEQPSAGFRPRNIDVEKLILVDGGRHPEDQSDTDANQRSEGCILHTCQRASYRVPKGLTTNPIAAKNSMLVMTMAYSKNGG